MQYQSPERDIAFLLNDVFDVQAAWSDIPQFADFTDDLLAAVVSEGGRIAGEVMAPLNQSGDAEGCTWDNGVVTTPEGFREGFAEFVQGGWLGLSGNPEFGGQGMPKMLGGLLEEMFWAANPSFYLYGTLTVGAALCIDSHGSSEQKAMYLPRLYSGEWTGAMDLTESHAGTDLGLIRTRAEPQADGSYSITGTKIFITSGEHDLAENIVHLVLAKLPDAPSGSKGISLFIVPKFLHDDEGNLGARNGVSSGSIEHKMGIRASATNVMNFDGATGYLLGAPNQGLACMFTMMNYERLSVGIQGLGAGEMAYQLGASYARDRLQGRAPSGPQNAEGPADSLLVHPDVRRMLLTARAYTEAGRAFGMFVGMQLDRAKYAQDAEAQTFVELLTPVAKAFMSDRGFESAVVAQQVFGGHGYIAEWGAEQVVRDTRIAQIYEGTNGVQAMDLIGRKVLRDGGASVRKLVDSMRSDSLHESVQPAVEAAFERLVQTTDSVVRRSQEDANLPGAVAADYLDLFGHTTYAWMWGRMAAAAADDDFGDNKRTLARYFCDRLLPRTVGLAASIEAASDSVMNLPGEAF